MESPSFTVQNHKGSVKETKAFDQEGISKGAYKTFGRAGRAQSMESPPYGRNFKPKLRKTGVVVIFKSQEHYLHCFICLTTFKRLLLYNLSLLSANSSL